LYTAANRDALTEGPLTRQRSDQSQYCQRFITFKSLLAYDNVLKRLAEEYPSAFVQWLLTVDELDIQKLPTELSLEPVRSDAVYFLPQLGQILHIEFQTEPQSILDKLRRWDKSQVGFGKW